MLKLRDKKYYRRCLMAVFRGLKGTFDTVASVYEKFRPGYVEELYKEIFRYSLITEAIKVVEIGIGGGQATLSFLQTEFFAKLEEAICHYGGFLTLYDTIDLQLARKP